MKKIIHRAEHRSHTNLGWLNSYQTFKFNSYDTPAKMRFGALRVLNEDTVAAGMGFGYHPHDNMEIISIPLSGELKHKDNTGREAVIRTGDVQIMSAGTGIEHAEMNNSAQEKARFLQIWILPKERNLPPVYEQKSFDPALSNNHLQTVISPEKNEEAIWINQDAYLSIGHFEKGRVFNYQLKKKDHGVYVFILEGLVLVGEETLKQSDGMGISAVAAFTIEASSNAGVLLMEVPL